MKYDGYIHCHRGSSRQINARKVMHAKRGLAMRPVALSRCFWYHIYDFQRTGHEETCTLSWIHQLNPYRSHWLEISLPISVLVSAFQVDTSSTTQSYPSPSSSSSLACFQPCCNTRRLWFYSVWLTELNIQLISTIKGDLLVVMFN